MRTPARPLTPAVVLGLLVAVGLSTPGLASSSSFSAPSVELDRYEFAPDALVILTIAGFQARAVTVTVCGNDGRRGSADCNMTAGEGVGLDGNGGSQLVQMPIAAPPVACPCIIRVSSQNNDEIAVAAITLIGHPVDLVVGGSTPTQTLVASIVAERASTGTLGWLRSSLGAATTYDVTVTVRNSSTVAVGKIAIDATVGRGDGDIQRTLVIEPPAEIGPGETWEQVVQAELPAPVYGNAEWRVDVSSEGPTVTATDATSHMPGLLILFAAVFVLDVLVLAVRLFRHRHRGMRPKLESADEFVSGAEIERIDDQQPVLVG